MWSASIVGLLLVYQNHDSNHLQEHARNKINRTKANKLTLQT